MIGRPGRPVRGDVAPLAPASLSLLLLAVVLSGLVPAPGRAAAATGPWYPDVGGHWAAPYILVLWDEDVLPPSRVISLPGYRERRTGFRPDSIIEPADFGEWLVRLFPGGRFEPPGIALELAGSDRVTPSRTLGRQEAVSVLIESLNLGDFARAMDGSQAATYLAQFRDGSSVAPAHRQSMALAIRLGMIDGYPDRTLKPRRPLSRAEAATVLYRSCLLMAEAEPNPFSPDGDGVEDGTVFRLGSLRNDNAAGWDLHVMDARGRTLRDLGPHRGGSPTPPQALAWEGEDDRGVILPPGVYYYRGWLTDRTGRVYSSALKPVVIETKSLSGYAHPGFVLPGETVRLTAMATGGPASVRAYLGSFPEVPGLLLVRTTATGNWTTQFTVPRSAPPGWCRTTFTADFGSVQRSAEAYFEVGRFAVRAELRPPETRPGGRTDILAWPNLPADSCEALVDLGAGRQRIILAPEGAGRGTWRGRLVLPASVNPGRYPVEVRAARGRITASTTLWLEVILADDGLTFILSG